MLRLTRQESQRLDDVLGSPTETGGDAFVGDLVRHAVLHPEPPGAEASGRAPSMADVVIPVRNHGASLRPLVDRLLALGVASITVVDDGSQEPITGLPTEVTVVRHASSLGPAAAREHGRLRGSAPFVAFVDADMTVPNPATEPDWLTALLGWFDDTISPAVGAVAPRIRVEAGTSDGEGWWPRPARYDALCSPLDLGPTAGPVAPSTRVSYVPAGMLIVRRTALDAIDGFDATLARGEDVDLVWRLVGAGWMVRYEPTITVRHAASATWRDLVRQRIGYGRGATALARRHPDGVATLEASPWSVAVWALLAAPFRWSTAAGVALGVASTIALAPHLEDRVEDPWCEAVRLAGRGNVAMGLILSTTVRRAWLPFLVPLAVVSPHWRRVLAVAILMPPVWEWCSPRSSTATRDPVLDSLPGWVAARTLDDIASCAGLWRGAFDGRSLGAMRPRFPPLSRMIPAPPPDWTG